MSNAVEQLVLEIVTDASDAVADMHGIGSAATVAGDQVEATGRQLRVTADGADELGGKAGKLTGSLGALSSGFELVGLGGFSTGLQSAAMATDFMSGSGDLLNLVMESTAVKFVVAKVQAVGHAVATGAAAVATGVMTAAQWALNAALSANPVALVVIAVLALVAAVVLAYKKSETFREIVQAAFHAVQHAAEFAFDWVKDHWPLLLAIITGPIGLAVLAVVSHWDEIKASVRTVYDTVKEVFGNVKDKVKEIFHDIAGIATAAIDAILKPFQDVLDLIEKIIDKINDIHLPDLPHIDLNPFGRAAAGGGIADAGAPIYISFPGYLGDKNDVIEAIATLLPRRDRLIGLT